MMICRARRIRADIRPFGSHHDQFRDGEVHVEFQLLEDCVVGFLYSGLVHRRLAVRRHEHAIVGVKGQHCGCLAAV